MTKAYHVYSDFKLTATKLGEAYAYPRIRCRHLVGVFFFFFLAGPVSKLLLVLSLPNIYVHVNILLDLT